ncbi:MAG: prepilin-type N-terminal cleavage/methylation domain-containing protein, partial [Candidatus Omnitrophica bacterium]|nr:prepilin-type N-terminal cleavage/methylation domain-containing protein [Candidatus Omnitrophota bacterium]
MKKRRVIKKSFTLIELIVVIAIIAILAAIIAPNAFKAIEKAKATQVMGDSAVIKAAAMAYFADTGWWPTTDSASAHDDVTRETENFVSGENQPAGWDGPYLDKWPRS